MITPNTRRVFVTIWNFKVLHNSFPSETDLPSSFRINLSLFEKRGTALQKVLLSVNFLES